MLRKLPLILVLSTITAWAGPTAAAKFDETAKAAATQQRDAVTIYVKANWGSRKNGAAKDLNDAHRSFQAAGYVLVSLEPHVENGDLEGFFVSYRRRAG